MKTKYQELGIGSGLTERDNPTFKKPLSIKELSKIVNKLPIEKVRTYRLRYLYNMTTSDYAQILESQNGTCAICSKVNSDGKALVVDHDHNTGAVRGLLCRRCNTALGGFNDDCELMINAVSYLREHSQKIMSKQGGEKNG